MQKIFISFTLLLFTTFLRLFSQVTPGTEVYLITCNPGTETYSHYGHSALRIVIPEKNSDQVFNWGVFDFSTSNFAWKFAKGRLEYMLDTDSFKNFLRGYIYEKRSVYQQKINIEPSEIEKLLTLISENLKPENVRYRYDFFYDDCSTRIRDLLEKSIGTNLIYPPADTKNLPTFRDKVGEYQKDYMWLKLGIDLIMGTPADKKASLRDQMFLPFDLQSGLSEALINRGNKRIPLLQNPVSVVEFNLPDHDRKFYSSPLVVLGIVLILIIIFSAMCHESVIIKLFDIALFTLYSILAILMIFFNFFTDHLQMKWNLNIIWLNPFLVLCLVSIVFNKKWEVWFKMVFYLALISLFPLFFLPHVFNNALVPLALILILRSSVRAGFSWNPFTKN